MKKYEVVIDYESLYLTIEANNEEEAKLKAIEQAFEKHKEEPTPNYWVGDCHEETK